MRSVKFGCSRLGVGSGWIGGDSAAFGYTRLGSEGGSAVLAWVRLRSARWSLGWIRGHSVQLVRGSAEFGSSQPDEGSAQLGFFRLRHRALPLGSSGNVVRTREQGKGEGAGEGILGREEG